MRLKAFFIAFEEISSGEKKNNNSKKEDTRFKFLSHNQAKVIYFFKTVIYFYKRTHLRCLIGS